MPRYLTGRRFECLRAHTARVFPPPPQVQQSLSGCLAEADGVRDEVCGYGGEGTRALMGAGASEVTSPSAPRLSTLLSKLSTAVRGLSPADAART